jgi:glutathione S-transferase
MTLRLHVFPPSPRAFKVLWCAHYLEIPYELVFVDLTKGEQARPEFMKLNPNARMPVLEEDGYVLWESNAIVNYLAAKKPSAGLLPTEIKARCEVEKWQFWESSHWDVACAVLVFERVVKQAFLRAEPTPSEVARGTQLVERAAKVLDSELAQHRFLCGDRLTVADFSVGADLSVAEHAQLPLESFAAVQRWMKELKALPSWSKTLAMQTGG